MGNAPSPCSGPRGPADSGSRYVPSGAGLSGGQPPALPWPLAGPAAVPAGAGAQSRNHRHGGAASAELHEGSLPPRLRQATDCRCHRWSSRRRGSCGSAVTALPPQAPRPWMEKRGQGRSRRGGRRLGPCRNVVHGAGVRVASGGGCGRRTRRGLRRGRLPPDGRRRSIITAALRAVPSPSAARERKAPADLSSSWEGSARRTFEFLLPENLALSS